MEDVMKKIIRLFEEYNKDMSVYTLARICILMFESPILRRAIPAEAAYLFATELLKETNPCKQE